MSSPGTRSPSASLPEASKDAHAVPVFTEMLLCLPSSCFHSLSTPNWTSSVKKTYTHICSHLTNPPLTSVFIAPLECPFEPCASPLPTCEHGRAIQLPQEIRDFTETMIFELSVNICRGEFACRRGEQGMHKGGGVGGWGRAFTSPRAGPLVSGKVGDDTRKAGRALCSLGKCGHAGPVGLDFPLHSLLSKTGLYKWSQRLPHASSDFSTRLLTITLPLVTKSVPKLLLYLLMQGTRII